MAPRVRPALTPGHRRAGTGVPRVSAGGWSPLTPGHGPGVNPPALTRDAVRMTLKLPCKVRPRPVNVAPRQGCGVVPAAPAKALSVSARHIDASGGLRPGVSDARHPGPARPG